MFANIVAALAFMLPRGADIAVLIWLSLTVNIAIILPTVVVCTTSNDGLVQTSMMCCEEPPHVPEGVAVRGKVSPVYFVCQEGCICICLNSGQQGET